MSRSDPPPEHRAAARNQHHEEVESPLSPHDSNNPNDDDTNEMNEDPMDQLFFADPDDDDEDNRGNGRGRQGTIASARFNMWSTMVGGGCLSLPLAFSKMGNALSGPLFLIMTAGLTEFCFTALVQAARRNHPPIGSGRDTYPGLAASAASPHYAPLVYRASTLLVTLMCFFGIVGYAVLLRDLIQPVTDVLFTHHPVDRHHNSTTSNPHPAWQDNVILWIVVVVVTPLCTLPTLTALQPMGAASMCAIALLGVCITYRSLQCTLGILPHHTHTPTNATNPSIINDDNNNNEHNNSNYHWWDGFQLFPNHWKDVLDVLPLFISCFVCHYNIPVVHNELQNPTKQRVRWWLQSTVWGATLFYLTLGVAGSAYQPCTAASDTALHGNILLDFDAHDPLLLLGRLSLAVTIALAFPMLTIPARDILILLWNSPWWYNRRHRRNQLQIHGNEILTAALLEEPLLGAVSEATSPDDVESTDPPAPDTTPLVVASEEPIRATTTTTTTVPAEEPDAFTPPVTAASTSSLGLRLVASILVLWTGVAVASVVSSIDLVWDWLGSSLSMILSFLIPCGTYWILSGKIEQQPVTDSRQRMLQQLQRGAALTIAVVSVPLMIASTTNAVYDTFWD